MDTVSIKSFKINITKWLSTLVCPMTCHMRLWLPMAMPSILSLAYLEETPWPARRQHGFNYPAGALFSN